jgi:hypothetical protein
LTAPASLLIPPSPKARNYRHGYKTAGRYAPEYAIWNNLIARCTNPNNSRYARYGGRGIVVCERWAADFVNFLADMGRRPSPAHSIDRIDNDCGYGPDNCRWATRKEQCRNRSSSRFLEFRGEAKTSAEWAEDLGIGQSTLHFRLKQGWSVERALTQPVRAMVTKGGAGAKPARVWDDLPDFLKD